jgi:phosphoadenosine phosphosulfate reductase
MDKKLKNLIAKADNFTSQELIDFVLEEFGNKISLATSFGAEDQVLTDMLCKASSNPQTFTLDTGRLPEETYKVAEQTRQKYNIQIQVLFPDYEQIQKMVAEHGFNLFYKSIENRKLCCRVRKLEPLKKELSGLDAWICGLRSQQSTTRTGLEKVAWDKAFGLIKICPLADWTEKQVWEYIRANDVPYNELHPKGYPSIGCEPCTRAIKPDEDIRAGRWWWENPEQKECGLHSKKPVNYQI